MLSKIWGFFVFNECNWTLSNFKLVIFSFLEVFKAKFWCFPRKDALAKNKMFSKYVEMVMCDVKVRQRNLALNSSNRLWIYLENDNSTKQNPSASEWQMLNKLPKLSKESKTKNKEDKKGSAELRADGKQSIRKDRRTICRTSEG